MNRMIALLLAVSVIAALPAGDLHAATGSKAIALALKVEGEVQLRKSGTDKMQGLKFGTPLNDGDMIRTGEKGYVTIIFADDKSQIRLNPRTEVTLNGKRDEQSNIAKRISMEVGEMFAKVEKQRGTLEIATPTSVASVKGTEFWVVVLEDGTTQVVTLEGLVELMNRLSGEAVNVGAGQSGHSDPQGGTGVNPTDPGDIPEGGGGQGATPETIEIDLQNVDGATRTMIIQYIRQGEDGE